MLSLALDTSTRWGRFALARPGELLAYRPLNVAGSYADALLPVVEEMLAETGLRKEDLEAVAEELRRLPAKERVVFCMRYLDDKPQQEIAAALSMSPGYVSKLLTRARGQLERKGWEVGRA